MHAVHAISMRSCSRALFLISFLALNAIGFKAFAVGFFRAPYEGETYLSALRVGQHVIVKHSANVYEIRRVDLKTEEPSSEEIYKVVGVASDFLVLMDRSETHLIRIPASAIVKIETPTRDASDSGSS